MGWLLINELNALEIPKHFMHGALDYLPADPRNVKILADSLNNADLEIIPRAGHMFFNKQIWRIILENFTRKVSNDKKDGIKY